MHLTISTALFLEIKDQCLLKLIWETRARTNIIILSTLYTCCRYTGRFLLLPSAFSVFRQSLWTRIRKCLGGNVRERELTGRKQEKGREKRSRMDNATRSWCNCMLMECASEYGIRMEAVRFDIPFCLRSSPLLDSTSTSSSGRLFVSVSFLPR